MSRAEGGRPAPRRHAVLPLVACAAAALGVHCLLRADPATRQPAPVAFLDFLEGSSVHNTVVSHFPGVMKSSTVMSKALSALKPYGFTRRNVIYGTAICPDEINNDQGHLTTLLAKHYGSVFPLGGLGGVPYVGKTGFFAFSHHVPDNGHVMIVFGPHLGYTSDGMPGKFQRRNQAAASTACGALNAAYAQLTSGARFGSDPRDTQQAFIRDKLRPFISEIDSADEPMVALVNKFYEIVEEEVLAIVNTDYGDGNLVLLGGITVNMPYPKPGYFLPLHFSVRSKSMRRPKDLMSVFR